MNFFDPSCMLVCCECETMCPSNADGCHDCGNQFHVEGEHFNKHMIELPNPTHSCNECGGHNHNHQCCVHCGCTSLSPVGNHSFSYDYMAAGEEVGGVDPSVVLHEHPNDGGPVSYMAFSNLKNMMHDMVELMEMLNMQDELPQWVNQSISEAADRLAKAKKYIYGRKDV